MRHNAQAGLRKSAQPFSSTLEIIMTEQLVLTLVAASVGFVAAVFFCIGNVLNSSGKILLQATPRYDFSEPNRERI